MFFNRIFFCKNLQKKIFPVSQKKTKIVLFPSIYNWISHVHTIKNKETKKINIPTHNCISTLDSLYLKSGCGQFLLPRPFKKSFSSKTKHAENIIEHNQQNSLSFQMAVPRPARSFFSLNSRISLAQNLAFRLPAMTNGLLLSVKADF